MAEQSTRGWVVAKFGGTSVSTVENWHTIADVVQSYLNQGLRPLVVCSALSGVTNTLEALLRLCLEGQHLELLEELGALHGEMAASLGLEDVQPTLERELELLRRLLLGASLVGEVSPRVRAQVMARGELLSTRLGAAFLRRVGVEARWLDARDCLEAVPDAQDPQRAYLSAVCRHEPSPALQEELGGLPEPVLLTQGFIARLPSGDTALLGRGGSDTSAAYLASLLQAQRCDIWTDVPGMFSANPRQIPQARLLRSLGYDEAQEIASTGAKVLHPRCIAPLRRAAIPLHIRCTPHPALEGTVISARASTGGAQVKAISTRSGQVLVSMDTPGMWQQVGFLADVFACFKAHQLSIDLVSTSEMNVTVSLDPASNHLDGARLEALVAALRPYCQVRLIDPCATVSLVGRGIRTLLHRLGPALEVFEAQQIHLVSQAASDLNLSFVVDEKQAERLAVRLHRMLFEEQEASALGESWEELFSSPPSAPAQPVAVEAPWWERRRQELLALAQRHQEALYVYDAPTLEARAGALLALEQVDRVFYATKANPCADILRRFEPMGVGFECVSPGELRHARGLFPGLAPQRLLFTPNFAPRQEYEEAFAAGAWVTLDNLHPLEAWPEVFAGRRVMLRVDPGQGRGHHAHVKTAGEGSKFGVPAEHFGHLRQLLEAHQVEVAGLHAHCGSGILTPENWSQTALTLVEAAAHFPTARILNLGGGLGVPEARGRQGLDLAELDAALAPVRAAHPRFELWLEPGRFLVAEAGVMLVTVTQLKRKGDTLYVGVNTGMNSLIRPALYGAWHEIVNLTRLGQPQDALAHVVGPICESGDTLGWRRRLAAPQEGDVLLVSTAGAYGRAMSSHYNLREPAREVMLP